jgi:cytosine/adenosine deaminase-related metal-dependent hydrolase
MSVTTRQAFEWATIGAAKSFGIDDKVGSVTPGKKADLIMFKKNKINFVPMHDPISSIVFHSNSNDVDTVIVNGVILKRDGQLISNNLATKLETLATSGHRIMHQYKEMQAMEKKEG